MLAGAPETGKKSVFSALAQMVAKPVFDVQMQENTRYRNANAWLVGAASGGFWLSVKDI